MSVPLEIYRSRISPVEPLCTPMYCSSPEKDTDRARFVFLLCRSRRYGAPTWWVELAARNGRLPNYGDFSGALSAAALAAGPSRFTALTEQTLSISLPVRTLEPPRGSQLLRGNLLVAARRGNGLLYFQSRIYPAVEETMPLPHPGAGPWSRLHQVFEMERGFDHGPRDSWFPGRPPAFRYPRRTQRVPPRRFSIPASPAEPPAPKP